MREKYTGYAMTACLCLVIVLLSMTRYADFDLWWHLKLGQSIVENGALYWKDTFSHTFAGAPQYTGEWLADLVIYLSYAAAGLTGVNLLKALVLLTAFHFLHKAAINSSGEGKAAFAASALTLLIALFAIRFRLFVRPYIFSFVFVSFFLFVLEKNRRQHRPGLLMLIPAAEALWVNMSVGAIFGPLIAFCYLAEDAFRNREHLRRNLLVFALTVAATLASPETWGIYKLTLSLFTDPFKAVVGEYQPMTAEILWGFGIRYTWGFQILALLAFIYLIVCKGWRSFAHVTLFLFFLAETFLQVRMIEFFSLVAAPMAAVPVTRIFSWLAGREGERSPVLSWATAALFIAVIPLAIIGNKTYPFGNGIKEDTFPDGAVAFLDRNGITGTMFNGYSLGGYLIWRAPERKVFFDGRYRRLYSSEFYREYSGMMENAAEWQAGEARYGFDHAVIEYERLSRRFPLHLNENPGWALVYWDNHSAVYLKRVPKFEKIIAAGEYRIAKPNFHDFSYLAGIGRGDMNAALAAVQRDIDLNPSNQEPVLAKAMILYEMGPQYRGEVARLLDIAGRLPPDLGMEHSAKAYLFMEQGNSAAARQEIMKAVELNPMDEGAWDLAKRLGLKLKMPKGAHP